MKSQTIPFFCSGVLPRLESIVCCLNSCLEICASWYEVHWVLRLIPECPLWTCQVQSREPEAYLNFHPSLSSYWLLFLTHLSSGWIGDLKGLSWSRPLPPGLKHYTPSKLVLIWKQNVGNFWLLISVGPMDCPCSITESFKRITHGFYSLSIDIGSMGGKKNRREVSAVSQLLLKETVEPVVLNHWQNINKS